MGNRKEKQEKQKKKFNFSLKRLLYNLPSPTISKKMLGELDFSIIMTIIALVLFSVLNIYSSTHNKTLDGIVLGTTYAKLQLMWLIVGLVAMYVIIVIDYSFIKNHAYLIYAAGVGLLILNILIGTNTKGATSWIRIGPVSLQPSEFGKLAIIVIVAKKLEDMGGVIDTFKKLLTIMIYVGIPTALVFIQPDMGMTMVIFFTVLGMVIVGKLDSKIIWGGLASLTVIIALVWNTDLIKTHQKNRLISFLDPSRDPLGTGYQVLQGKTAVGSGGLMGSGFLDGAQTKGGFIPESWTDAIFTVVGEEWGFIGSIGLIAAYTFLLFRMIKIAQNAKDVFGSILVIGVTSSIMFSVLQNIGMNIGLMPVTGITLPFMSYGGSSMLVYFMSVALVLNVGMRKKKINF